MVAIHWKKYTLICVGVALAILAIGTIKVDVPSNVQGTLIAHGRITNCEFHRIGRHGGQFFMGVTLDKPSIPLLRFNAPSSQRESYEAMCSRKPTVQITYHAIKRVFGPVSFWIDRVAEG